MSLKLSQSAPEKVDVDELWASLHPNVGAASTAADATGSARNSGTALTLSSSSKAGRQAQVQADKQVASAAATAAQQQVSELSAQLSAASLRIAALECDNELLQKEARSAQWIQQVLRREGILAPSSEQNDGASASNAEAQHGADEENAAAAAAADDDDDAAEAEDSVDWTDGAEHFAPTPQRHHLQQQQQHEYDEQEAEADEQEPPPTVPRASIMVTSPSGNTSSHGHQSQQQRGQGVTRVSRALLRHLQSYQSEVRRYRRFASQLFALHAGREAALSRVEHERLTAIKVLTHLLRKHPQLLMDPYAAPASGQGGGGAPSYRSQTSSRAAIEGYKPRAGRVTSSRMGQ